MHVETSYLLQVILGEPSFQSSMKRDMKKPPTMADGRDYDSVLASPSGDKMAIVYDTAQAYPMFLLTFKNRAS